MKGPQTPAGFGVESANVALHVGLAFRHSAGLVGGADHDHVIRDDGRRMQTDIGAERVDHLIVVVLQIHYAAFAEGSYRARRSSRSSAIIR